MLTDEEAGHFYWISRGGRIIVIDRNRGDRRRAERGPVTGGIAERDPESLSAFQITIVHDRNHDVLRRFVGGKTQGADRRQIITAR